MSTFLWNCPYIISYPLLVHEIRENIYGLVPYSMRPKAEWNMAPDRRYFPVFCKNKQWVTILSLKVYKSRFKA